MSVVVKVLEGVVDVEENIDYNFCNPPISNPRARVMYHEVNVGNATALLDSVLSGPRWQLAKTFIFVVWWVS